MEAQIIANVSLLENSIATDNQFQFSFRRGRRDDFLVIAPKDYRVEKVIGDNIKSWTIERLDDGQQIRITLLKTAVEQEKFRILASRQLDLQKPEEQEVDIASWKIPDASVTRGQIHLFATQKLAVTVRSTTALSREDISATSVQAQHPTLINPVSAFRYSRSDHALSVAVKTAPTKFESNAVVDLFVYRGELNIEAKYSIHFLEGESSQVQLFLPAGWRWELGASNVGLQLEVKPEEVSGQLQAVVRSLEPMPKQLQFSLVGKQSRDISTPLVGSEVPLPVLRVMDSWSDRGNIVLWADRGLEAVLSNLSKCSPITGPRGTMHPVRNSMEQKTAVQFLLQSVGNDQQYGGQIRWQARKPIVETVSVSNAKLTKQSIEQTIYIEWVIREAGISEVSFVLPGNMKDANIAAQMARKITRTPLTQEADSPVRITIQLQDQILGEYRVLVQNDLHWSDSKLSVPLVSGMTGNVRHQFVTVENSGFDELVIDTPVGMQPLVRGDSYWNEFAKILGGERVQAYRIADQFNASEPFNADQPKLAFSTRARSTVQTVNARIGLASTVLSVDADGNYRGTVEYRMENFSEPYLEVELPVDSQLWSVHVAESPVKPGKSSATMTKSQAQRFRIPLVRTQLGDLDYGIRLVYAGKLSISGFWSSVEMPFIRAISVQPEQSQLRLHLPPSMRWYRWEGTLGQVQDEQDLTAGWLSFRNGQLLKLNSLLSTKSSDDFSQSRAVENIRRLNDSVQLQMQVEQSKGSFNERLLGEIDKNSVVVEEARKQQAIVEQEELRSAADNRTALGNLYLNQSNWRANGNKVLEQSGQGTGQQQVAGMLGEAKDKSSGAVQIPQPAEQQAYSNTAPAQQAVPFNQDRQQADAKQMAQRYRSKIQSQAGQQSNAQYGAFQSDLANNAQLQRSGGELPAANAPMGGASNMGGSAQGAGGRGGFGGGMAGGLGGEGGMPGGMTPPSGRRSPTISGPVATQLPQLANNPLQVPSDAPTVPQVASDDLFGAIPSSSPVDASASGLRSVDIQVPVRGTEYLFVTPKGEMRLVAHGVATAKLQKWALALAVLLAMVVLTRKWK